jgi:raffinose/stachyose/melibiose transport system substrate-binding protein
MWKKSEPQAHVLSKAIHGFEETTGIQVNVQWQGRHVLTKVTAALHGGNVPDLVDQGYGPLKSLFVPNKQYTDLTSVYNMTIPGESQTVRQVIPKKLNRLTKTSNGEQFQVPYEITPYGVWYNQNRLPNLSKHAPTTWHQFTDFLAKRKAQGKHPLALGASMPDYVNLWVATVLARTLGPNGLDQLVADKNASSWKNPAVSNALDKLAALVKHGYFVPGYASSQYPAVENEWVRGHADLLYLGSWLPSETSPNAKPGFKYAVFNFPKLSGNQKVPITTFGFVVPKDAQHKTAAEKFIAYFMNKQRLSGISSVAKNITPRTDIPAPPALAGFQPMIHKHGVTIVFAGLHATEPDYMLKIFDPLSVKLMTGQITVPQFISKIQRQQKQYWSTHK